MACQFSSLSWWFGVAEGWFLWVSDVTLGSSSVPLCFSVAQDWLAIGYTDTCVRWDFFVGLELVLPPWWRGPLFHRSDIYSVTETAPCIYISYLQIAMFKAQPNRSNTRVSRVISMELATGAFVAGRHWQQAMDCCHAVLFE